MAFGTFRRLPIQARQPIATRQLRPRPLRSSVSRTPVTRAVNNDRSERPENVPRTDLDNFWFKGVYYPCYGNYVLAKQDDLEILGLRSFSNKRPVLSDQVAEESSKSVQASQRAAAPAQPQEHRTTLLEQQLEQPSHAIQVLEPPSPVAECSIPYPGTRVCTTVDVTEDIVNKTCTITIKGTLQSHQLWDTAQPFQATALRAIEQAVHHLAMAQNSNFLDESRWVAKEPLDRHHEISNILQYGKVVEAIPNPANDFGHKSYRVKLKDRTTGRMIGALFKPRVAGDCQGWHRVPIEVAAYHLGMLLGLDTVPPAVVRKDVDVGWKRHREGAFCYWADDCQPLGDTPSEDWGVDKTAFLSDTRILDVLMQNSDRHRGHFLRGRHWASGRMEVDSGRWRGHVRPILIDHAAGFRKDALVRLEDENAFETGATEKIVSSTYMRLLCLNKELLAEKMGGLLTEQEIAEVLHRRNGIIRYFDTLIAKRGFDNVVLKCGAL